jgi:hypothetical protein
MRKTALALAQDLLLVTALPLPCFMLPALTFNTICKTRHSITPTCKLLPKK